VEAAMQFGIFSVGDVTTDPTTGRAPTEHERIKAMVTIALKAEEAGLDVFATGEHHNPPFVPSSPTTMLGYIAARTSRRSDRIASHPCHCCSLCMRADHFRGQFVPVWGCGKHTKSPQGTAVSRAPRLGARQSESLNKPRSLRGK
jgi:ribosomal protein L37AE/L43A